MRIAERFAAARRQNRAALVAYVTAGDPAPEQTPALVAALERGGADIIELGVPFSDPIADGPVIQRASDRALRAGMSLRRVLETARHIRAVSKLPLVLFTYMNPVVRYGAEALARDAAEAGIDGCLLTDLSVEEAEPYTRVMRGAGLDTIFLAAPTSTERRLELVAKLSSGFVYLVSRTGVTGERESVSQSMAPLLQRMRDVTPLPIAVGFGISTREQVRQVAATADGVVVGSAIVRLIEQHGADVAELENFARDLAAGLDRSAT